MKFCPSFILFATATLTANLLLGCGKPTKYNDIKPIIQDDVFIDIASRLKEMGASDSELLRAEKEMRVEVTKGVKEALLNQYSLIHLKEKRIFTATGAPFNTIQHLNKCVEREETTKDTSDLRFIDRLKQCVAGFQDTHLNIGARVKIPAISAGIVIRKIDDKYYIYARQSELLDYLKKSVKEVDIDDVTAVGNEVLEIDGKSPAELSKHYATFVRASSESYRNWVADTNIFYRDYDYPTQNFVSITVKSPKKLYHYKLPWWGALDAAKRQDAKEYFQSLGIATTDRVRMHYDKDGKPDYEKIKFVFKGYLESDPIAKPDPFSPLVVFNGDSNTTAARMGIINTPTQRFCYLQLLTFASKKLKLVSYPADDTAVAKGYLETVKDFIVSCKENNLNLVIDLRSNNGGMGSYPYKILSLLAKPGTNLGTKIVAYRANQVSARLLSSMMEHPELNSGDLDDADSRSLDELKRVLPLHQLMTGALPISLGVTPDLSTGGFAGKVIGLITPSCISACDGMSALLKRSGRGVLLGTGSNGTGAGFMASDSLDSTYQDSYLEVTMKIPNYQFGYSSSPFISLDPLDFDSHDDEYFMENRPTIAHKQIDTTLADILGKKRTWLDAVVAELAIP